MSEWKTVIAGLGSYLPEKVYTNADMERMVETNDEWITQRTGIKERHIAREDEFTSDLATVAANRALEDAGMSAEEIDLIIVATVSPDMHSPSVAALVGNNIGATKTAAFDINVACSGFVTAMSVADQFIRTGFYRNILIIGADTLSKITDYNDRATCILFGDGAGAAVLTASKGEGGVLATLNGADCSGADKIYCDGLRDPKWCGEEKAQTHKRRSLWMNGSEVMKFAVRIMSNATKKVLEKAGLTTADIDHLIPHQANMRIIEGARKRLEVAPERLFVNLDQVGNMSGASIPVAMCQAYQQGRFTKGDVIAIVGFGAGLTWAAAAIEWSK
ncbi:MAG: ketoacyl-ACP synthase III [Ruminococcaceae bacterium]|nr:ketoacyl-ACP synthase III [Oscillospiraceae bacterium]